MNAKAKAVIKAAKANGVYSEQAIVLRQKIRSIVSALAYLTERGTGSAEPASSVYTKGDIYAIDERIRGLMLVHQNMPKTESSAWVFLRMQLARKRLQTIMKSRDISARIASYALNNAAEDLLNASRKIGE